MRRRKRVEIADIPSDSESADGFGDSDGEEEVLNSGSLTEQSLPILDNICQDEESTQTDITALVQENSSENEISESVSKPRTDIPFSKSFGPNISETATSPLEIFSCLFPSHLLDHIVQQIYLLLKKTIDKVLSRRMN